MKMATVSLLMPIKKAKDRTVFILYEHIAIMITKNILTKLPWVSIL